MEPIVAPEWLAEHHPEVVVADVRWYLDGRSGREAYRAGHLPGAVWIDLDGVLADPPSTAEGRHPLPSPERFADGLGVAGIGDDQPVVAYDDVGGMAAGRLVWLLRVLGQPAALLDGGLAAWGGPLATGDEHRPAVRRAPQPWPREALATADETAALAASGAGVVLDARAAERYRGEVEPIDSRAGHIPGARNAPFAANLDPASGRFLSPAELRRRFEAHGVGPGAAVVVYCGSGVSACHDLLALAHAGIDPVRARLYPGSWSQWSADPHRPVATGVEEGPGRRATFPDVASGPERSDTPDVGSGREANDPAPLEGIDLGAVTRWYEASLPGSRGPLRFERLPGGHSNLTYRVTDAAGQVTVLRRPPLGELLPSAHDMSREHRIISALRPVGIPVAPALGFCADPSVTGAPFYVMGFVEGAVLHTEEDVEGWLGEAERRRAGESLVEVAAALHAVDVEAVGLADLGRHDGYVARQMKRWYSQYRQSRGATPLIDRLHDDLAARLPAQQRASVVHGDYRLGNCITGPDGNVVAVLDWEISTLGDPLADLAYLLATWSEPGDELATISTSPSKAPGFPTRDELAAHYAARSDLDCSALPFYLAFSYWKLACINQGVWARYDAGQKSTAGVDVAAIRSSVDQLAERAAAALAD